MRIRILCGPMLGGLILASSVLAGCTTGDTGLPGVASAVPSPRPETQTASTETHGRFDRLISRYSAAYDVPESLIHRVVKRESNYNPKAYHAGNYGLMQIRYRTAKGLGYEGSAPGLYDAETNLKYAVKYLKGAWLVAGHDEKRADWLYRTGYYYDAKRKGMLDKAGWDALAAVQPKSGPAVAPMAAPMVATAEAEKASPVEAPTMTASIQPASSRFGEPATSRAASVVTASAPATAMGYAGSVPTGVLALPNVMIAPPERPGS
jgi:hypothetical protein